MTDTSPYFKTAAGQLRRALDAKRQDLQALHNELDNARRRTNDHVNHIQNEIKLMQGMVGSAGGSQGDGAAAAIKANLLHESQELRDQISRAQTDESRHEDEINRTIHNIEREIIDLEQLANDLEQRT